MAKSRVVAAVFRSGIRLNIPCVSERVALPLPGDERSKTSIARGRAYSSGNRAGEHPRAPAEGQATPLRKWSTIAFPRFPALRITNRRGRYTKLFLHERIGGTGDERLHGWGPGAFPAIPLRLPVRRAQKLTASQSYRDLLHEMALFRREHEKPSDQSEYGKRQGNKCASI